jgi:hypothetical protein
MKSYWRRIYAEKHPAEPQGIALYIRLTNPLQEVQPRRRSRTQLRSLQPPIRFPTSSASSQSALAG